MAQGLIRPYQAADYQSVAKIFWETTTRTEFASALEREEFQKQYLDSYLSQLALVYETDHVVGYIVATVDTLAMRPQWPAHLELFSDLYVRYPAHLHINLTASVRGQGYGRELTLALEVELVRRNIKGLHLITSATARNVSFYLQNGYTHKVERLFNDRPLLFLGKTL